jgi:hypothetical protein
LDSSATVIQSAPIEQLVASSTVDIAEALSASRSRWRLYKALLAVLAAFCVAAVFAVASSATVVSPIALFVCAAGAVVILSAVAVHGLQSSTVSLDYDLSSEALDRFKALGQAFDDLARCSRIWKIPQVRKADWKRDAGASQIIERQLVIARRANPSLLKTNVAFLQLQLGKETLYFTPDAILVVAGSAVAAFHYIDINIHCGSSRFVEDGAAPSDAQVVGETWQFVNRSGGPDRRFNNNRKLPICLYGAIEFRSASGLNECIECTRVGASEAFTSAIAAMRSSKVGALSGTLTGTLDGSPPPLPPTVGGNTESRVATDIEAAYANETEPVRALAMNHGKFWEFLLVEELLKSRLQAFKQECDRFNDLVRHAPKHQFDGAGFVAWIGQEMTALSSATKQMVAIFDKRLGEALGEPGVSGDAVKILDTINSSFVQCRLFLAFEVAVEAAEVPYAYSRLRGCFSGITLAIVQMLEDLCRQWTGNLDAIKKGSHNFNLKVNLEMPQFEAARQVIDSITATLSKSVK